MPLSTTEPTSSRDEAPVLEERVHAMPLPPSREDVISTVKQMLALSGVKKIEITARRLAMTRAVRENEPIFPESDVVADPTFLLPRLELVEISSAAHPFLTLERATSELLARGLKVSAIFAPQGPLLGAFLGREDEPKYVFGYTVVYTANPTFENKLLVVGGTTAWVSDATHAVVIDPYAEAA